jgi:hypothetical protein
MATATLFFHPFCLEPDDTSPAYAKIINGTNHPFPCAQFSITDIAYITTTVPGYSSAPVISIFWYADSDDAGNVEFTIEVQAITPNTDTQDVETDGFDTGNVGEDAHLGTTAQRLHQLDISLTNVDSLAAGDFVRMRISRTAPSADDLSGIVSVVGVQLSYTTA